MLSDEIKSYVKLLYTEDTIAGMMDLEILEWIDEEDSDQYDCDLAQYLDTCGGEAEAVILRQISRDVEDEFPDEFYSATDDTELAEFLTEYSGFDFT